MTLTPIGAALLATGGLVLALSILAFWIWMLVDCVRNEPRDGNDRLVWILVIVFVKVVGAVIYYFMRYRHRRPLAVA